MQRKVTLSILSGVRQDLLRAGWSGKRGRMGEVSPNVEREVRG